MAAYRHSLTVTDGYRFRLQALRHGATDLARRTWAVLDPADLDRSHAEWVTQTAAGLTELQRVGAQLSAAYLAAFMSSELVKHVAPPDVPDLAGVARDGRPLTEALVPSLFTIKGAIGEGQAVPVAMKLGFDRAVRMVGEEAVAPAREAVSAGIAGEGRILGWRRVTGGGCGACLGAATGAIQSDDEVLEVHPYCSCTKEPVVADVPDRVDRPSGAQIFEGMAAEEQDRLLGPDKAELVRSGDVPLHALVQRDPQAAIPTGITEAPLEALHPQH